MWPPKPLPGLFPPHLAASQGTTPYWPFACPSRCREGSRWTLAITVREPLLPGAGRQGGGWQRKPQRPRNGTQPVTAPERPCRCVREGVRAGVRAWVRVYHTTPLQTPVPTRRVPDTGGLVPSSQSSPTNWRDRNQQGRKPRRWGTQGRRSGRASWRRYTMKDWEPGGKRPQGWKE